MGDQPSNMGNGVLQGAVMPFVKSTKGIRENRVKALNPCPGTLQT